MKPPRLSSRLRQQGMVTVMAVLLLITVVIFALGQTLGVTRSNSLDNEGQMDSVATLFLAESGLERGQQALFSVGNITNLVCTGVASSFSLGRGTVTLSATSTPATCDNSGGTPCTNCVVQATANIGSTSRTITREVSLTSVNGTACDAANQTCIHPTMTLKNTYSATAIALFSLAHRRLGNQTAAICNLAQCALQWNIYAQNGVHSVGSMGNSVSIGPGLTYSIVETLSSSRSYAEVGGLFPGSGSGPSIVGAYWNDTNSGSDGTHGKSGDSTGTTNNGSVSPSVACNTPGVDQTQLCTNWCYGGDTIAYGFAAHAAALTDALAGVHFDTAGTPSQNVALTRIAKFPNAGIIGAPPDVFSEIWYAHNPNLSDKADVVAGSFTVGETYLIKTLGTTNFTSIGAASNTLNITFVATGVGSGTGTAMPLNPYALNASSYKGNGTGAIGALFTASTNANTLTVTAAPGYPSRIISPGVAGTGDTLSSSGGGPPQVSGNPTITSQVTPLIAGESLGGIGRYIFNGGPQTVASKSMTASSKILHVTACTICFFAPADPVVGTAFTISSQPSGTIGGVGEYLLSGTPAIGTTAVSAAVLAGTAGTTIYLRSTESTPAVTTPNTRIAKISGTGTFAANTTVTAVTSLVNPVTNSFTVSPAPTVALNVLKICAGTCALFDQVSATTTFSITRSTTPTNGVDYWASGFMCLKGQDITPIAVTSSSANAVTWHEVVK